MTSSFVAGCKKHQCYPNICGYNVCWQKQICSNGLRKSLDHRSYPWWRHEMITFSASLALCDGKPLTDGFSYLNSGNAEVFFVVSLNNLLKEKTTTANRRRFETQWRPCDSIVRFFVYLYFRPRLADYPTLWQVVGLKSPRPSDAYLRMLGHHWVR